MSKKTKVEAKGAEAKTRKTRTVRNGQPTKITIAKAMLIQGTTMKDIEKATGDTSYAAIRALEADGYTFDRNQRDGEGRIFYKAVAPVQKEAAKAA